MPSWTPRLPISFQAGTAPKAAPDPQTLPVARLQVIDHPDDQGPALVTRATADGLGFRGTKFFLCLAHGSDCVLTAAVADDGSVGDGQIAATEAQQHNLHLGVGLQEEFRVFVPPLDQPFELVDAELEVALLGREDGEEGPLEVDARALTREFLRLHFGSVLALNEACVLPLGAARLLLRCTATNTLDAEAREEQLGYHCYRGMLSFDTQLYISSQEEPGPAAAAAAAAPAAAHEGGGAAAAASHPHLPPQSLAAARSGVVLVNARRRPAAGPSRSCVSVRTSDGEMFPVHRRLLRPCIALTRAVRSEEDGSPEVEVAVDTLTFDRVLIFLEALALGREPPAFGLHLCPQLLAAAQQLGLRALEASAACALARGEYAQERLGECSARLRLYSFEEIQALNAAGGCWLILHGMIMDVTRWLPEHPGGSRIIPRQSLNLDCSRFFEVYHASRESFVYLRQFYMGEVAPEDRPLVPGPDEPPSPEFLQQLREYTAWRLPLGDALATHLGAKRRP